MISTNVHRLTPLFDQLIDNTDIESSRSWRRPQRNGSCNLRIRGSFVENNWRSIELFSLILNCRDIEDLCIIYCHYSEPRFKVPKPRRELANSVLPWFRTWIASTNTFPPWLYTQWSEQRSKFSCQRCRLCPTFRDPWTCFPALPETMLPTTTKVKTTRTVGMTSLWCKEIPGWGQRESSKIDCFEKFTILHFIGQHFKGLKQSVAGWRN